MNRYTELSDFEINRRIAEMDTKNRYVYFEKEQTIFRKFNNGQTQEFNPCNNPADAMPIINEYGISLVYQDKQFQFATNDGNIECCIANPLKAAMIIFLCMKDAENEKV